MRLRDRPEVARAAQVAVLSVMWLAAEALPADPWLTRLLGGTVIFGLLFGMGDMFRRNT